MIKSGDIVRVLAYCPDLGYPSHERIDHQTVGTIGKVSVKRTTTNGHIYWILEDDSSVGYLEHQLEILFTI